MANPVLSRPDAFTPAAPTWATPQDRPHGYGGYAQAYAAQPGYGQPPLEPVMPETMTVNDVLNKTAIILALLVLSAGVAYSLIPAALLYPAALICGLVSIIFPFLVATRHDAAPALTGVYAAVQGVFVGGISKIFETYYPGIVVQAVLGTFVTAGVVVVAFRQAGFRATPRGSKIVRIGLIAFGTAALVNLVLWFFGLNLGLFPGPVGPVSPIAWIAVLVGVGLATYSLLQDFTYIERGVAMGAPAKQSWLAAFGLVVTLVFMYTQLLRLLSYIRR